MSKEFYFFDLETSGLDARWHRVMQFAGQRTDAEFEPIGEPDNLLVKLPPDVLPEPEAILVTKITPQQTLESGITEKEFADFLVEKVFTANTTALGYNTIRFDDEFIRNTLYRNFYDPYEREWRDGRKRWDVIDLVRITRALRPDGINWPVIDGQNSLRLEHLSVANDIEHTSAHDALSDVRATIELIKLIKERQPKLFEHVLKINDKKELATYIDFDKMTPFVHCTQMISSERYSTSVFVPIAPHPTNSNQVIVYDLKFSPKKLKNKSIVDLQEMLFSSKTERAEKEIDRLPIKLISLNKSPVIAPLGVLDEKSQERIGLTLEQIQQHHGEMAQVIEEFRPKIVEIYQNRDDFESNDDPEGQIYDGFFNDADKKKMAQLRSMSKEELATYSPDFADDRLNGMLLGYKARNFPEILSDKEQAEWEQYVAKRLNDPERGISLQKYGAKLKKMSAEATNKDDKFVLEELYLYAQSILPYQQAELL